VSACGASKGTFLNAECRFGGKAHWRQIGRRAGDDADLPRALHGSKGDHEVTYFTIQPASIGTDCEHARGILVSVENRIIAVFTQLSAEYHGDARGFWFLEAGFGRCAAPPREPFERLSEGLAYLARNVTALREELAIADREFRRLGFTTKPS
jgi:hypothetical protein